MIFRQRIYLDGTWQFQFDPTAATGVTEIRGGGSQQAWRQAQVPLPWQAQFDDLRHTSGMAWSGIAAPLSSMNGPPKRPFCTSMPSIITLPCG
jgi:hypothetical protein